MTDYKTVDKTGWFIQHMKSAWLSRQEIVELAAKEFPSTPAKTLDGTIDNTGRIASIQSGERIKAIQARGLRVEENSGKRRIVDGRRGFRHPASKVRDSTPAASPSPVKKSLNSKVEVMGPARCGTATIPVSGRKHWTVIGRS